MKTTAFASLSAVLVIVGMSLVASSCGLSPTEIESSTNSLPAKHLIHGPICGVKELVPIEHPSCGPAYIVKRSQSCGVELNREQPDFSCPSSRPISTEWTARRCGSGEKKLGERDVQVSGGGRNGTERFRTEYLCERWQVASCRRPEFGVELYRECEHKDHGLRGYKTCEVQGLSPITYYGCEIYSIVVEATIKNGEKIASEVVNGVVRETWKMGTIQVITENAGELVVTVMRVGG